MTIPIVSHSHDGIRVNINGVVDVFGNAVQIAESYSRHKVTCQTLQESAREKLENLARTTDRTNWTDEIERAEALHDAARAAIEALTPLMEHCRR